MAKSTKTHFLILFLCVALLMSKTDAVNRPTAITLQNNGYKGILVAIHPSVKEDSRLVSYIQSMFVEGSSYLYSATEKRAYFQEVTILVPNTWSDNPSWPPSSSQLYENADIIVQDPVPTTRSAAPTPSTDPNNQTQSDGSTSPLPRSFTRSYGGCGQQGVRIHIFTNIFGSRGRYTYGPTGRLLVHQWAHFRWGVFEEFSQEGEPQFYFSPTTGQLEAVRCNINMQGRIYRKNAVTGAAEICSSTDPFTGMYHEDCVFDPYTFGHNNDNITASIMDSTKIMQITNFCNGDRTDPKRVHNYEAPSRHNRLCGSRSTWEVITSSADFANGANPPRTITNTAPSIKVVRLTSTRRMVMAIDTSNSMGENDKLTRARQAATSFIEDVMDDGVAVGVVSFGAQAQLACPMINVSSPEIRRNVSRLLPKSSGGRTSIGSALLAAVKELERHDKNASDAFIVLVTDGKETEHPRVKDVLPRVKAAGAVVSVITFSDDADKILEKLAEETGGRYYYDNNQESSMTAVFAMLDIYSLYHNWRPEDQPIQILSKAKTLAPHGVCSGKFLVDASLGAKTGIVVTYNGALPEIVVTSPSGRNYRSIYPEFKHDPDLMRAKITIPGLAEIGPWSFYIENVHNEEQKISILASSYARDVNNPPIKFTGTIMAENGTWPIKSQVVAEVTRDGQPVRNLKVKAIIDRPMAPPVEMSLYDSGAGADAVKDDGIYSRFFTRFSVSGRYTVHVEMTDANGDVLITGVMESTNPCYVASAYAGSIHIEHPLLPSSYDDSGTNVVDEYPPMRITDLRVLMTSQRNRTVVLAWTAPGDDGDFDRASDYAILVMERAEDFLYSHTHYKLPDNAVVQGDLNNPKMFGEKEMVTLRLDVPNDKNISMVFSVFARDDSGNKGELSNLVTVGFGFVPDITTPEYLAEQQKSSPVDVNEPPGEQKVIIASVVGFFAGILVVVIIGSFLVQFLSKNVKKEETFVKKSAIV